MKKAILFIGLTITLGVSYLLITTALFKSKQLQVDPIAKIEIPENAIERLQKAIAIPTISYEDESNFDSTQFEYFNKFLLINYPLADSLLDHRVFNNYSHLYKWEGKDQNLKPVVLMAHTDVVPIASLDKWTVDPFSGTIKDGKIWGRGTIDDKFSMIAILEGVEMLLKEGFVPERSIYLAFGHDEEVGGEKGAKEMANYLESQNIEAEFVLDEGYAITQKLIPGLEPDVALIGIAEKGSVSIELTVDLEGGHSSQPSKQTAIDVLAQAVAKLKANPLKPVLSDPMLQFIDQLGPEMGFVNKLAFANKNLFKGLIIGTYENASNAGNALVRTTTSPTIFQAGVKENVIPTTARAIVNFRIMTGQTIDEVVAHVISTINDNRVMVKQYGFNSNPSLVSPIDSRAYGILNRTIKQIFENTLTAPNLVIAATDSRHFQNVSENIYRFVPYHINEENVNTFHGIDERITIQDFEDAIRFYTQLIRNAN